MKKRLLAILMILVSIASLCACGAPSPTETVDTFLTAVKAQDKETVATVYGDEEGFSFVTGDINLEGGDEEDLTEVDKVAQNIMFPMILEFDYKLSNEVIDGDKASVDVTVTTYDFGTAFYDFMSDYITQAFTIAFSGGSEEELDKKGAELLTTELENLTEKDCEMTATVTLTATDDGWVIDEIGEDHPFYDAMMGGLIKTFEQIETELE